MKIKTKTKTILITALLPALSLMSHAGEETAELAPVASGSGSWYWSAEAGFNYTRNLEIEYPTLLGRFGPAAGYQNLEMDDGYAAGLALGYAMAEDASGQWSFEFEALFSNNSFSGSSPLPGPNVRRVSGDLDQLSLILSARRSFSKWESFTPYIGLGIGGSYNCMDVTQQRFTSGTLSNQINADDEDIALVYQATLGVEIPVSESWTFFTEYRFSETHDSEFILGQGPAGYTNVDDEIQNHSLLLGFKTEF